MLLGLLKRIFTGLLHSSGSNACAFLLLVKITSLSAQDVQRVKLTRLYVEPFTTKSGAEDLRRLLIAELRKHGSPSLVSSSGAANAILDGGGELWIKGYRSLNPRAGTLPSNATATYGGYFSVELKDAQGRTFWSYLATPGTNSDNLAHDLAKRIARQVIQAMELGEPAQYAIEPSRAATVLRGAGATFPAPVYEKWFKNYRVQNPNLEIRYQAVGSEAGIRSLLAGEVDFAATDSPQAIRDLAGDRERDFVLVPTVVGAVVPIVNLPGVAGELSLTAEALAGIYSGKITRWNDPTLKRSNRGVRLPDLDIVVVHRSDGSGTSYAWTDYLAKKDPEWRKVGPSLSPEWPVGRGAKGSDGVANMVKEQGGAIGYVEFVYALQKHISFANVQNSSGEFVSASLESMAVAASQSAQMSDDLKVSIVDAPGFGSYPIASFTWLAVPKETTGSDKRQAMHAFLHWMLGPGQTQAAALGYLALPANVLPLAANIVTKLD